MPNAAVISIAETDRGLWLGTRESGLFRFDGKRLEHVDGLSPDEKINCLLAGENGDIWIGTDRGIVRWTTRGISSVVLPPEMRDIAVLSLLRDREGNIWAAAGAGGLIRINGGGVSSLKGWDARSMGSATTLFEDRERNLWVGTSRGIARIHDGVFATYSGFAGLRSDRVGAIHVDGQGRAWFAPTHGGLYPTRGRSAASARRGRSCRRRRLRSRWPTRRTVDRPAAWGVDARAMAAWECGRDRVHGEERPCSGQCLRGARVCRRHGVGRHAERWPQPVA